MRGSPVEVLAAAAGYADLLARGDGAALVWGSLGLAVVLVAFRWLTLYGQHNLGDSLGEVEWSFTDSWASTLTAAGALLGTILATSGILPENAEPLTSTALAGLNLLFGALVVVAPLLFSAFQRPVAPVADDEAPRYKGYVWSFLLACTFTVWAVVGELATLVLVLREIQAGVLSDSTSWLFLALLVISVIAIIVYSWIRIGATVEWTPAPAAFAAATRPRRWRLL
jgi:hypothetical protein